MKKNMVCILCPNGCEMMVEMNDVGDVKIIGAQCLRGRKYATDELLQPTRTLTTSVQVLHGRLPLVSVRTSAPIPKEQLQEAMAVLKKIKVTAPIICSQVLFENFLGLGVNVITTKDVRAE